MSNFKYEISGGTIVIILIILKLTNVIGWSWFWVLSPIWFPILAVLAILIGGGITIGILALILIIYESIKRF